MTAGAKSGSCWLIAGGGFAAVGKNKPDGEAR
jgi:hypothetical protein